LTADHQETRPRGRPPVGPDVKYRLTAEIRQQVAAAMRPGESEAAAVRRLLTVALNPLTAIALRHEANALNNEPGISGQLYALADLADPPAAPEIGATASRARRPRRQSAGSAA
jgi:hypothetical protein